ncbi:methionine synthase [candidate division KSB1 bacterium]|nr:methionine synthase [candidate division KSB1 bacterium]
MTFRERLPEGIILFEGAMGTEIQKLILPESVWQEKAGCNELLNLTAAQEIEKIHAAYLQAGADVVKTNTFGANQLVLSEYALESRTKDINQAAVSLARRAIESFANVKPRYIAGDIGPGTKLISLGQTDYSTLYQSYRAQVEGLLLGGIDLFLLETCQDPLQIKVALHAIRDGMAAHQVDLPIAVSVTIETTGRLLVGTEIDAVIAALMPFNIDLLGLNCATGPEKMRPFIKQICQQFPGVVLCQPNAGLPINENGKTVYKLPAEIFVTQLCEFIRELGVRAVGGCCGTTPDFIRSLNDEIQHIKIATRNPQFQPSISSLYSAVPFHQDPGPFFIGERTNTNGSKKFREYLLANDWDGIVDVARNQQQGGAHGLDVCVAYTGRDEAADIRETIPRINRQIDLPVFIDSTDPVAIEEALQRIGGRPVINSINLEDGEARVDKICSLAKRYGAALIALTIDEKGMALEVERKLEIAKRIYDIAVNRHKLLAQDLIFDTLTFTLGSGDESLKDAGIQTIEAIHQLKKALPGAFTILGVSNISFGLKPESREILNSVFLAEAVKAGLDLAIVNTKKILPLYKIDPDDREQCLNLIYNRGDANPLMTFIKHFDEKSGSVRQEAEDENAMSLDEKIQRNIINGIKSGMEKLLMEKLKAASALEIINALLIPAMKDVGELFASGEMQLPFVLQSAEVMKFSVDLLQPFMEKKDTQEQRKLVLATVRGDVHDIGKNLVDIILTNNGYKVYNLGIKCEIDAMLRKVQEVQADAIGMSGLLVKSTVVMKENLEEMAQRGIHLPVLLGGAALTPDYVNATCAPLLSAPVIYCKDAFEGLAAMEKLKTGQLEAYAAEKMASAPKTSTPVPSASKVIEIPEISRDIDIPVPPFRGEKIISDIDLGQVFSYLNEIVLFRGRWGFRRGKLTKEEFAALETEQVRPAFEALKQRCRQQQLLVPQVIYGYYPCQSEGNDVIIYHPDTDQEWLRFHFPRQKKSPHQCIADFFLPVNSNRMDLIVLQVVTVGHAAAEESKRLFHSDQYKDYLLFHGLSVEASEALAELWHRHVREELQITHEDGASVSEFVVQKYRGSRYSFGYPACPDLEENRKIFDILKPERIGVTLTEGAQMVPEQTTSAFVVHHPQAKYFTVD